MECEVCGCHDVHVTELEGFVLEECRLCGNLQGDDEVVARIDEIREGRREGIEDSVYPLVKALRAIPTFKTISSCGGHAERREPPYVWFTIEQDTLRYLEKLCASLSMANRRMRCRWVIEVTMQRRLTFELKPNFHRHAAEVDARRIGDAIADLDVLARTFRRDRDLAWFGA
jgi:hypothetical protein